MCTACTNIPWNACKCAPQLLSSNLMVGLFFVPSLVVGATIHKTKFSNAYNTGHSPSPWSAWHFSLTPINCKPGVSAWQRGTKWETINRQNYHLLIASRLTSVKFLSQHVTNNHRLKVDDWNRRRFCWAQERCRQLDYNWQCHLNWIHKKQALVDGLFIVGKSLDVCRNPWDFRQSRVLLTYSIHGN